MEGRSRGLVGVGMGMGMGMGMRWDEKRDGWQWVKMRVEGEK